MDLTEQVSSVGLMYVSTRNKFLMIKFQQTWQPVDLTEPLKHCVYLSLCSTNGNVVTA